VALASRVGGKKKKNDEIQDVRRKGIQAWFEKRCWIQYFDKGGRKSHEGPPEKKGGLFQVCLG